MVKDKDEIDLCWKALEKKMDALNFSENEREYVKQNLLHQEAK